MNLTIHVRKFNEKVRLMNQTNAKMLSLSSQEARDLQADIYELLSQLAQATSGKGNKPVDDPVVEIKLDGGSF